MPVFSGTVACVSEAINSDNTSALDVAQVVLRDASLTGRLLKMANSIHFNPGNQQINTVSRAVMVLGFDQVRVLTMSLVLVDSLSGGSQRQKLTEEMAQSFHAAIQAQQLACKLKIPAPEDIFVATLLSKLGNMAFWAFSDDQAEVLLELIQQTDNPHQAEIEVLGFPLTALTRGLTKSWSLGELLDDFINGRTTDNRVTFIKLGRQLAEAAEAGWESDAARQAIHNAAKELSINIDELEEQVFANARHAREVTRLYGSVNASRQIPQPPIDLLNQQDEVETAPEDELAIAAQQQADNEITYPEPDAAFQMTVMQEITNTIQERPSIGIILEMVLEGIHRGVGTDRAMFAILNPERTHLSCKYVLGDDSESLREKLRIDIQKPENIFNQIIKNQKAMLLPSDPKQLGGTLSRDTLNLLGTPPYMVMPTIVRNKVIGLFMADRKASGRALTEQDFLAFQQFCQQANMGLTFLAMQG
ncbi:HDOD domain-containing protein [Methylophaga sp. OBS4]|uniref:HDOD domain-containing protein n=1 Tax=Methylophaga sp. OBS4 TaxID=2991935 RepID=UPI002252F1EE|nr:HDOD domain-containing protein [Methylophaga sp. OBS4]MCX4188274.1 HDOD domain-containing protein [Methylophaga sp. OBS4]